MTKRIPIRAKLALALLIPVLCTFAVAIYEVGQANREVDRVRQDTDLASAALGPKGLIRNLQDERNDSAISAIGLRGSANLPTDDLAETRSVVDGAVEGFRAALVESGPRAAAVYAKPLAEFEKQTASLRERFDASTDKPGLPGGLELGNEMWNGYTDSINLFIEANTRLTLLIEDPELRNAAEMLDGVSRQIDTLGVMVRTGIISSLGGAEVDGTRVSDVIASMNEFDVNKDRIVVLATGPYAADAREVGQNSAYTGAIELLQGYVEDGKLDTAQVVETVSKRPTPNLDTLAGGATSALQDRSATLRSDAETNQRTFVGLALLVLVAGGGFLLLAARSITRPLLSLTRQADEMATERLPSAVLDILDTPLGEDVTIPPVEPVAVKSRDEVQEVATALNSVQSAALDLAVEQAVLRRNISDSFVNLGRRTQNLIGRQLDFITELERNETDPEALDNLFKLDHLATRARRNAESLVVLAGQVSPRTWTAPIAMSDVVRAATGEVEDYQRVEAQLVAEATVPGRVAADLVHLLAELLENGLQFSPPGRPVEVYGRMTRNGYVLSVVDQGIGMPDDELVAANDRLAGRESYTVAPSRYLGHYVAGSLAQRIGVVVRLDESPTGGIAAKIVIPEHVMDQAPALPSPQAPPRVDAGTSSTEATPTASDGRVPIPASTEADDGRNGTDPVASPADEEPAATTAGGLRKRQQPAAAAPAEPTTGTASTDTAGLEVSPAEVAFGDLAPRDPERQVGAVSPANGDGFDAPVPGSIDAGPVVVEPVEPPAEADPMATPGPAAPSTTANGLRKRVRGEGLATSGVAHQIRRGTPVATADPAQPPSDSAAADDMFSLLSTFESGVERGRQDFTNMMSDLDEDPTDADVTDPEDQR